MLSRSDPQTGKVLKIGKLRFIGLLHRTTKYVIPRRGDAPTWESPGTMFVFAAFFDGLYQEIATSHGQFPPCSSQ